MAEGHDAHGHFAKGNRPGRGGPYRSPALIRTYGEAIARSCPPEKLATIIEKAVKVALTDGPEASAARAFILRAVGIDQIRLVLPPMTPPPPHLALSRLSDDEFAQLQHLLAKSALQEPIESDADPTPLRGKPVYYSQE